VLSRYAKLIVGLLLAPLLGNHMLKSTSEQLRRGNRHDVAELSDLVAGVSGDDWLPAREMIEQTHWRAEVIEGSGLVRDDGDVERSHPRWQRPMCLFTDEDALGMLAQRC
jgi:hypothetical protein